MSLKILIIDDDPSINQMLKMGLEYNGYQVAMAQDGAEGLKLAYRFQPDLVILDVMMPEMDGFETCSRLREISDVPILMLTARSELDDVIQGFGKGADDYLTKPFQMEELEVRIKAILRRAGIKVTDEYLYNDGFLKIDLKRQEVFRAGQPVHLTPTEYRLLDTLVNKQGSVVSHDELLKIVWGAAYKSATVLLSVYISYLRDKLEEDPQNPRYIRTKWGRGYWFEPQTHFQA